MSSYRSMLFVTLCLVCFSASAQEPAPVEHEGESIAIIGNQELPRSIYIIPWKESDLGDLPGRPVESLLDEGLEAVDRDVFQRELEYYATGHSAH